MIEKNVYKNKQAVLKLKCASFDACEILIVLSNYKLKQGFSINCTVFVAFYELCNGQFKYIYILVYIYINNYQIKRTLKMFNRNSKIHHEWSLVYKNIVYYYFASISNAYFIPVHTCKNRQLNKIKDKSVNL